MHYVHTLLNMNRIEVKDHLRQVSVCFSFSCFLSFFLSSSLCICLSFLLLAFTLSHSSHLPCNLHVSLLLLLLLQCTIEKGDRRGAASKEKKETMNEKRKSERENQLIHSYTHTHTYTCYCIEFHFLLFFFFFYCCSTLHPTHFHFSFSSCL